MILSSPVEPRFEQWVRQTAGAFPYPTLPPAAKLADRPRPHRPGLTGGLRLVWVPLALLLLTVVLLAVPPVRATLLEILRIGSVEIQVGPGAPTPAAAPPPRFELPNLPGRMSLAEAERWLNFDLRLPAYPEDLGPPDGVYVYSEFGQTAVFAWQRAPLLLQIIDTNILVTKIGPASYAEPVEVGGQEGFWVTGPRSLQTYDTQLGPIEGFGRVVDGNVLIWAEGDLTYRLETDRPLAEAIRIAESLQPAGD